MIKRSKNKNQPTDRVTLPQPSPKKDKRLGGGKVKSKNLTPKKDKVNLTGFGLKGRKIKTQTPTTTLPKKKSKGFKFPLFKKESRGAGLFRPSKDFHVEPPIVLDEAITVGLEYYDSVHHNTFTPSPTLSNMLEDIEELEYMSKSELFEPVEVSQTTMSEDLLELEEVPQFEEVASDLDSVDVILYEIDLAGFEDMPDIEDSLWEDKEEKSSLVEDVEEVEVVIEGRNQEEDETGIGCGNDEGLEELLPMDGETLEGGFKRTRHLEEQLEGIEGQVRAVDGMWAEEEFLTPSQVPHPTQESILEVSSTFPVEETSNQNTSDNGSRIIDFTLPSQEDVEVNYDDYLSEEVMESKIYNIHHLED